MFTELTTAEATELDERLYLAECRLIERITDLDIQPRTKADEREAMGLAGVLVDVLDALCEVWK